MGPVVYADSCVCFETLATQKQCIRAPVRPNSCRVQQLLPHEQVRQLWVERHLLRADRTSSHHSHATNRDRNSAEAPPSCMGVASQSCGGAQSRLL